MGNLVSSSLIQPQLSSLKKHIPKPKALQHGSNSLAFLSHGST